MQEREKGLGHDVGWVFCRRDMLDGDTFRGVAVLDVMISYVDVLSPFGFAFVGTNFDSCCIINVEWGGGGGDVRK